VSAFSIVLQSDWAERVGWTLLHSLWQIVLLAAVYAVVSVMLRNRTATVRYVVGCVAFVAMLGFPLSTYFRLSQDGPRESADFANTPAAAELSVQVSRPTKKVTQREMAVADPVLPSNSAASEMGSASATGDSVESVTVSLLSAFRPWLPCVTVAWLMGAILFLLRPVWGWLHVRRLQHHGVSPLPDRLRHLEDRLLKRLGVKQAVRFAQSALVEVPTVVGYLRPAVLLPVSVLTCLSVTEIELILAHELAHVRRHDYLVNLAQTVIEAFFFYHPGMWWLSNQIRQERENCCDDAAVAVSGDRAAYGRALLALESLRGTSPVLALGSHGGSLATRIRRLLTSSDQRSAVGAEGLIGLGAVVLLVGVGVWAAARADDTEEDEWGTEVNGLVCRIVPVDASMDDEAIELDQAVAEFEQLDEITFAVELKNVGKRPITLLGVQYGANHPSVAGKPNANHFAPHLFEFEFTDRDGKAIPRTERRFSVDTHSMILSGASAHELDPNQSLKFLLRPARFERSMDHRLASGKYRLKVRYRGPNQVVLEKIREHWPDKPQLNAWAHEVESNAVGFSIAPDPDARRSRLVWGPAKDGLQAALEIRVPPRTAGDPNASRGVMLKTPLLAVFHVKNVSDKSITFVSESPRQGDTVHVIDAAGEEIEVRDTWVSGWPIDVRWTLQPGDIAHLTASTPSLNDLDRPGQYSVHFTIRFNSRIGRDDKGNVVFPAPGDWQSELDTGKTPLFLNEEPAEISANGEIHGRLIDDETGKPIRGAIVACGAIINDSGRGGGDNSTTDSAGNYRLKPPSPGIYNVWLKKHPRSSRATAAADDGIFVEAGKISKSELRVVDGRRLTGKVVDENGKPIEHIVVRCHSTARPQSGSTQSIRTKADGSFAFSLPPGRAYVYTVENVKQTDENPFGIGRKANAVLIAPRRGILDALTLTLKQTQSKFGSNEWLRRTTPGTKIVKHENDNDVTGTVVDTNGKTISNAKVFKTGGSIVKTNEKGEFRIKIEKGTQFIMHAVHPGYRVWLGTPTAGDELKIVLERKRTRSDENNKVGKAIVGEKVFKVGGPIVETNEIRHQSPRKISKPEKFAQKQLQDAIQRGGTYLRKAQEADGSWKIANTDHYHVGVTALCTLALLKAGVKTTDAQIQKALAYLRNAEPTQTYDVSLQLLVYCAAEPKNDLRLIRRNVEWLEGTQYEFGPSRGGWSYEGREKNITHRADNSNSEFAIWALDEAVRVGAKVDQKTWSRALEYWKKGQRKDGSWGYRLQGSSSSGSMTCCGMASWAVCWNRNDGSDVTDEAVSPLDLGFIWMRKHFRVNINPRGHSFLLYYLMAMRRVGDVAGNRLIGDHDWYREGAAFLLEHQNRETGQWAGSHTGGLRTPIVDTALALLFLQRGPPLKRAK